MSGLRLRTLDIRAPTVNGESAINNEEIKSCELNDFEELDIENFTPRDERYKHSIYIDAMKNKAEKGEEVMFDPTLLEGFINDPKQTV